MEGKKTARQRIWEEFYFNVGLSGFKYLFSEFGWRRLFWWVGYLGALAFSVYLCYDVTRDFAEFKAYSSYRKVLQKEFDFPTVTICNINSIMANKVKKLGLRTALKDMAYIHEVLALENPNITRFKSIIDDLRKHGINTVEDLINGTENTMYDMLRLLRNSCRFFGAKCTPEDFRFTTVWMMSPMHCSQFNFYVHGKEPLKVNASGIANRFELNLNLQTREYLYNPMNVYGLFIQIHPYGTTSFLSEEAQTFFLTPGKLTVLEMSLAEHKMLGKPYEMDCGEGQLKIIKKLPYSRNLCIVDCTLQKTYKECGCVEFAHRHHVENIRICGLEDFICYRRSVLKHKNVRDCYCPWPCLHPDFTVTKSMTTYGTRLSNEELASKLNDTFENAEKYRRMDTLGIWIYYRDLVLMFEETKRSVTLSELLGNIGGNVGLCIGFSVITIYEYLNFQWDIVAVSKK